MSSVMRYARVKHDKERNFSEWVSCDPHLANLKLTFDNETGELIGAEVHKENKPGKIKRWLWCVSTKNLNYHSLCSDFSTESEIEKAAKDYGWKVIIRAPWSEMEFDE